MLLRIALSLSAALLTTAAIAEDAPTNREIVVIGQSLKDTERAWQDCIARGCPPDQEIRAALAHTFGLNREDAPRA